MYNDPDMQKIVILENKLNPVASLVYGAKNALPVDPFGKTYENAVEKLYDAVGADQSAYDTLHNTMEGTRSASSNAQTQNPVAYLGGYMGTNLGLYKGGKDIMLKRQNDRTERNRRAGECVLQQYAHQRTD